MPTTNTRRTPTCEVDAHTDSHRIYPHTIKVPMCQEGRENEAPELTYPDSQKKAPT